MFAFDTQTMFFHWFHCVGCILLILLLVVIALMLWRWRVHRDPLPPRARTVFNRTFHRKRNEENEIYSGRSTEMPNRQHTVSLFSCFLRSHDAISEEVFHLRWDTSPIYCLGCRIRLSLCHIWQARQLSQMDHVSAGAVDFSVSFSWQFRCVSCAMTR